MNPSRFEHVQRRSLRQFPRWTKIIALAVGLIFTVWELFCLCKKILQSLQRRP